MTLTPNPQGVLGGIPAPKLGAIRGRAELARQAIVALNRELGEASQQWGLRELNDLAQLTEPLVDAAVVLKGIEGVSLG